MSNGNKQHQSVKSKDVDFMNNYFVGGRFPVYKYEGLTQIIDNDIMTVEKMPMFVDGKVVWTHFSITLKPAWKTPSYQTDVDIRFTLLDGKAWLLIEYKGKDGAAILEAGDIVLIPAGALYSIFNQSKTEICKYTMDANTLVEME